MKHAKSHKKCVMCGETERGLNLRFKDAPEGGVEARWTSNEDWQGYQGILHGGISYALMDAAMCNAIFQYDEEAVTVKGSIRYYDEAPLNHELRVWAEVYFARKGLFKVRSILYADTKKLASCEASFMKRGLKI